MYEHPILVLVPKTLTFKREMIKCPECRKMMEKHITCEGARFHVPRWDSSGEHCSCEKCEINHRTKHYNEEKKGWYERAKTF